MYKQHRLHCSYSRQTHVKAKKNATIQRHDKIPPYLFCNNIRGCSRFIIGISLPKYFSHSLLKVFRCVWTLKSLYALELLDPITEAFFNLQIRSGGWQSKHVTGAIEVFPMFLKLVKSKAALTTKDNTKQTIYSVQLKGFLKFELWIQQPWQTMGFSLNTHIFNFPSPVSHNSQQ